MVMMMALIIILAFAIIIMTSGETDQLTETLQKFAATIFPKMKPSSNAMPPVDESL